MLHELEEKGPSTLGIFRRGPNVRAMREVREQLDEFDPSAAPVDGESGVDIGNSCKQVNMRIFIVKEVLSANLGQYQAILKKYAKVGVVTLP